MVEDYRNDLEIRVFTLRRTGHHAIIDWIASQMSCGVFALLTCSVIGEDPFYNNCCWQKKVSLKSPCSYVSVPTRRKNIKGPLITHDPHIEQLKLQHKPVLLMAFENFRMSRLLRKDIPINREKLLGKSKRQLDIIVLRDVFNWLASNLHHKICADQAATLSSSSRFFFNYHHKNYDDFKYYPGWEKDGAQIYGSNYMRIPKELALYKEMAKEATTRKLLPEALLINYNRWFTDIHYRHQLAQQIGFEFSDASLHQVPHYGGGSSFDGMRYKEEAQCMDVLKRWKHYEDNKLYWMLLEKHKDAVRLSNEIFSIIPGTESHLTF